MTEYDLLNRNQKNAEYNTHDYIWSYETLKRLQSYLVHCNGLCYREKNINAAYILELNSKCTSCEIALNTDEYRCYCCRSRLRKRSSQANRSKTARLKYDQHSRYQNKIGYLNSIFLLKRETLIKITKFGFQKNFKKN